MSHIIECRRPSCCHSRASRCEPPRLAGEAGQLRGGRFCSGAPLHSDTVKDSSVIIAYNAAPALLGGSDGGGISFSKGSQTPRWPASPGAGHARPVHDALRTHLGCCQTSLPQCLLAHTCFPHRQRPAVPTAFRLAERSSPQMQLEWRTSTRLRESHASPA
jgi:hypothetical protein